MRDCSTALLGGGLAIFMASGAAAAVGHGTFGSMSFTTMRSCAGLAANADCDGGQPVSQNIQASNLTGGVGQNSNSSLNLIDGSSATGSVGFDGGSLPVIRGTTVSTLAGATRINSNNLAFQAFTFGGSTAQPMAYEADMHIVSAGPQSANNKTAGGAVVTEYVAIWDPSALTGVNTAQDLLNKLFYADCSVAGVLATGSAVFNPNGGDQTASVTTTACAGGTFMIQPGQTVLTVAGMQLPVNRGGSVDASHTFTVQLSPALPPAALNALQNQLAPAVVPSVTAPTPTPVPTLSEWAMILFCALVAGGGALALTRRRQA